jgi:hypothetical protein
MSARNVAAASSFALVCSLALAGCAGFYEIPIETPIQPKMDVTGFQRVLVAGFISGGSDDVDANLETVRLLRSQLRSKSPLRVIEAEVLPLAEIAAIEAGDDARTITTTSTGVMPVGPIPTADMAKPAADAKAPDSRPAPGIRNEKDLAKYDKIFADVAYWKKLGEEYQTPLIVTGTVLFTPQSKSGMVSQTRETYDNLGRRIVTPTRVFMERKGYILRPKFIFIDGRTGTRIYAESFREERLYPSQQNVPALSSYFELMDDVIPRFLNVLSTQKVRGTRVLLK